MIPVTKAIIATAGFGTRRLPITKAIEKCMLPIGNRPIIDYVVEDCLRAGIRDFYVIVSTGSTQVEAYYSDNHDLKAYLTDHGQPALLPYASALRDVKFHYIEQPRDGKYGSALPISLAYEHIQEGESVVMLSGDDFIYNADGSSEIGRLIAATPEGGSSLLGVRVAPELVSRYGVLEIDAEGNMVRVVEKPAPEMAPSNLINVSKYIINHDLAAVISAYASVEMSGEYRITDPINQYITGGGKLKVAEAAGQYLDGGTVEGWLRANYVLAQNDWR